MNWVTTNIRFPEDIYMELKMEAARKRRSIADIVRESVAKRKNIMGITNVEKFLKKADKIAREISRQNKGKSLSKALIEMRYEQ